MTAWSRKLLVCIALFCLMASQACAPPPIATKPSVTPTVRPREPSVLRFAIPDDPRSLEPCLTIMLLDSQIALNLHAGLFTYDADSKLVSYLVQQWEVSDDGTVYTFHLRDDVKWHNGRFVTADDFKKGWERCMDPGLSAWGAGYLQSIVGAKEMLDGQATNLQGVEVVDSHTLKVTLTHPDPVFLLRLGTTPTWVVPPEAVMEGQPKWTGDPVGAGPFRFLEWQSTVRIVLEANPDFFMGRPTLDRLEFLIVPDAATALNMYKAGEVDIIAVSAGELQHVGKDPVLNKELHSWTKGVLTYIGLNMHKVEAFRDSHVRQAFNYAIDRKQIIEKVLFNACVPATGIVPPNVPGHNADLGYPYDPEKARILFAEAGYPGGDGFPSLQFVAVGSTDVTAAEAITAQLSQNLGLEIEVFQPEEGDFYEGLWSHDKWDMFLSGWTADYLSAEQWLYRLLYGGLDSNFVGYDNPEYNATVDKAIESLNDDERAALWQAANQMAMDDAAMIPFGYGQFIYLVKPNVSGFACTIFEPMGFERVVKE